MTRRVGKQSTGICHARPHEAYNNPRRIYFTDGSQTRYKYSATGEKLLVEHYVGSLTLRNGRVDKLQFEEGYCQAAAYSGNTSQDNFTFHYYDRDHLGNIRQVINAIGSTKGTVIQTMDYYPFGAQFCHSSTASEVQPYKYNGKEFDNMHGLNTYDYGARQYNPVTARWDRVDPLSEKYYSISPYAYCGGNPVMQIDPDGRKPGDIFTSVDDAAVNFGRIYNYHSIVDKGEYAGVIYRFKNKDGNYSYTYAVSGKQSSSSCKYDKVDGSVLPQGVRLEMVGTIHTHADFDDIEGNTLRHEGNAFSKDDIKANMKFHDANPAMTDYFVCTTNGHLLKHWYNKDENRWYNIKFKADKYKLPSDPNDPSHNKYTINAINAKVPFWIIRPLMDFDAYLEKQKYK